MSACKTLLRTSISSYERRTGRGLSSLSRRNLPFISASLRHLFSISPSAVPDPIHLSSGFLPVPRVSSKTRRLALSAVSLADGPDEALSSNATDVPPKDTVEELLASPKDIGRLMKMERRSEIDEERGDSKRNRWFPYLDQFLSGDLSLTSFEVLEALDPYILDSRKERIRKVVESRSYSVCLVVEGLRDFGNVSAALRSADALGFQSVHVVSCDSSKRYRDNRHVSMGAEKWLDIEIWNSTQECFKVLKSRGYRIATTHVGMDAVSVYDMDWACPTAIVVGNEHEGISDEALQLSDLHCSIPMNGMVDSFNVSVAAGILMHHAVCDRISRLGCHGDLTVEERQILLAEFSLRHSKNATSIAVEYANRKLDESIFNIS